jgi:NodT family efflux transporter outer membrane factor (OMF) lipoprotein
MATLQPLLPSFEAQSLPDDVPVDIISRRPDLAAAKARVDAAGADTASAKAEFYPNVSLSAFIGLSSFGLSNFFELGSTIVGAGPAIHLPIFDADKLRANLRSKNADLDISIASYNQVLLQAIHDIADQMTSIKAVRLQRDDQQAALNSAESAYRLATIRYQAGLTTLLTVLNTEDSLLRERSRMVNLRAREIDLNIALIKSLGGGFDSTSHTEAGKPS